MKEDKEKYFILPDKNKNSEESLKETVDYYRKVQKKLHKISVCHSISCCGNYCNNFIGKFNIQWKNN